jgi:hypothetical protein
MKGRVLEVVGAKGFEPSTSWSRNSVPKILKALSGVAYETETADSSLSVVPKLYLDGIYLNPSVNSQQSILITIRRS